MNIDILKNKVYEANLKLVEYNLVTLTWGNVSGIDRAAGVVVIKPSGVAYKDMQVKDMVVVDLNGQKLEGNLNPSSDTPTHVKLYNSFPDIGGVCHTHSLYATMFAQARKVIPCYGTTHADYFSGSVPVTRVLTEDEVNRGYEKYTGSVIVERFKDLDPLSIPGVLVASHAPFTWGKSAKEAVKHSLVLEKLSEMAYGTIALNPDCTSIENYILKKHYSRKHGPNSYYGQKVK